MDFKGGRYRGFRRKDNSVEVYKITGNTDYDFIPLPVRLDLASHSPDGFEWGYGGSGPAQLALAILADYLPDESMALQLYQQFKWEVIAKLELDGWILREQDLIDGIKTIEKSLKLRYNN